MYESIVEGANTKLEDCEKINLFSHKYQNRESYEKNFYLFRLHKTIKQSIHMCLAQARENLSNIRQ